MTNTLKVVKPFFVMEVGDTFEKTEKGTYKSVYSTEYSASDADGGDISSEYNSTYEISESYAKSLIAEGFLVEETKKNDKFVNVFDEIDRMTKQFQTELDNLDEDYVGVPACLKTEKLTVLTNLLTTLNHLSNLKK